VKNVKIDKVLELDELVEIISKAKSTNKIVVHCHGVFDLIHIGHIRHFEEAKKLGDMLIVTITPDKYVNKGPHRPAFTEKLRAEVIASVDCVNYVAINNWPTAVKTIEFLRPSIYAKGIEYNDAEKDYSKGIVSEERAIKKIGGELKFTDNITFSSSNLINKYLDVLSRDVKEYLTKFSKTTTSEDLIDYLERIKNMKILVIGEAIIDEYQFGQSIGKAAKESIIALKYLKTEKFAGGTLAIGNHLSNFCDNVHLFTLLGDIDSQEDFISKNLSKKVKTLFHYKKDSPTIVKRRFIEEFPLRKLLEFYIFNDMEVDKEQTLEMKKHLLDILPKYDLVIVADFGHGMLNKELINVIVDKSKFLAVTTQTNASNMGYNVISKYRHVDYICTDERELRLECQDKNTELIKLIPGLSKKIDCKNIIATHGNRGCITFSSGNSHFIPAFTESVIDTMGAGDAFLSLTAPLVALDVQMETVGFIGNAVGSMYVKVIGNKDPIDKVSLYKYVSSLLR
jgi:rfaE bifunctional protein nucleotidyltransferase chain/domain|tara:strand:- start:6707 stop:8236 length:1530 start_codon:yes stop_codon:yes gene_type:complete